MNVTQLTDDPDFSQLVRDTERLKRPLPVSVESLAAAEPQDAQASVKTFNKLEKEFQKLQGELTDLPDELTPQEKQKLEGLKKKLISLQKRAGQELGLTQKEFSLLVDDLSKRSAKLMEKHPELAEASDETRNALFASAAKPVLLTSMSESAQVFVSSETEATRGTPELTSQGTCIALATTAYVAANAAAAGTYIGAMTACAALVFVPFGGPFLVATCAAGASLALAGAYGVASAGYTVAMLECGKMV